MMELESIGKTTLNQHLQKSVKLEGKYHCCSYLYVLGNPSFHDKTMHFHLFALFLSLVCRGRFSVVRKCLHKATKREVAVKFVNKKMQKKEQVAHEADILKHVQHPQLVALTDTYESPIAYILVLEL